MRLKIVRCFDYFDGWFDVTGPVKPAKAVHKWFRLTKGGTQNTGFTTGGTYFEKAKGRRQGFILLGLLLIAGLVIYLCQ